MQVTADNDHKVRVLSQVLCPYLKTEVINNTVHIVM